MATLPRVIFWRRIDTDGSDLALIGQRFGLVARGDALAATPIPHHVRYDLVTDETWTATRLEVTAEGAGWLRSLRLERAAGRWRVTTAEQGDLDAALLASGLPGAGLPGTEDPGRLSAALDIDLGGAPLFNTLPIRRLGLLHEPVGTEHQLPMVFVRVPSLEVLLAEQVYSVVGDGQVGFQSGQFSTELTVDKDGFVTHYPGLAQATA